MEATINDIIETDKIVVQSIKEKRGKASYSERMEAIMLTYSNVYKSENGLDCLIRLKNGTFKSIYDYV